MASLLVPRMRRKLRVKYYSHIQRVEVQDITEGVTLSPSFITSYTRRDGYYSELWAFLFNGDVDAVIAVIEYQGKPHYEFAKLMGNEVTVFFDGTPVLHFARNSPEGYGIFIA